MIKNPTQQQIDQADKYGMILVNEHTVAEKLASKALDKMLGTKPEYVNYNGRTYESSEITILTREEIASVREDSIPAIVRKSGKKYSASADVKMTGNINRVQLDINGQLVIFDYSELYWFLKQIENQYDSAVQDEDAYKYTSIRQTKIATFRYIDEGKQYTYEFKNGFYLDTQILKDNVTGRYKGIDLLFSLETKDDYLTEKQAQVALESIIFLKLRLLTNNKRHDQIFIEKVTELEDDKTNDNKTENKNSTNDSDSNKDNNKNSTDDSNNKTSSGSHRITIDDLHKLMEGADKYKHKHRKY